MIALVFLGEDEKEEVKLFSAFCGCRLFFFLAWEEVEEVWWRRWVRERSGRVFVE